MKIYTKTGDAGKTRLVSGAAISKDHERLEAYGSIDELGAHMGMLGDILATAQLTSRAELLTMVSRVQNELFHLGSELATPNESVHLIANILLGEGSVIRLEEEIDAMQAN